MIKWTKVLLKEKKLKNNHTTKVTTIFIKTNKNKVKGTRKCENWWKRNSLAATLCGRAHNLITARVHRNRNWITIYFFKNIRRLNPQKKKKLQKTQLDKNPENVILCLVGEKVNAKTVATVNENRWKKKKNFSKKSLKNRFQKTKAFCRERPEERKREKRSWGRRRRSEAQKERNQNRHASSSTSLTQPDSLSRASGSTTRTPPDPYSTRFLLPSEKY